MGRGAAAGESSSMTRSTRIALLAVAFVGVPAATTGAQTCLPFGPGEHLTYAVRAAMMGAKGETRMWVTGPELVRGRMTFALHSDASVGVGFIKGTDRTVSWIDPVRFAALRFTQVERHVISRGSDSVEIYPEERRWERSRGRTGETLSDAPLDILSFIYRLRTLPLGPDSSWTFSHHFDVARNPTTVRVVGRDSITTPAGVFQVWDVEMRVRDKEHFDGDGVIKLLVSADSLRLPVRIQSVMPTVGTTVMTLKTIRHDSAAACPLASRVIAHR
jgi:hypothetical protein